MKKFVVLLIIPTFLFAQTQILSAAILEKENCLQKATLAPRLNIETVQLILNPEFLKNFVLGKHRLLGTFAGIPVFDGLHHSEVALCIEELVEKGIVPKGLPRFPERDLSSQDPEVRLQAALVLTAQGRETEAVIRQIFKDSAVDENLTLAQRIKAAKYLTDEEKKELGYELKESEEHQARIDKQNAFVLRNHSEYEGTQQELEAAVRNIPEIKQIILEKLIKRIKKLEWKQEELVKVVRGVYYFSGAWKNELSEKLLIEHDFPKRLVEDFIRNKVPDEIKFSALEYIYAVVFSQEVIQKLHKKGAVIMDGDRDWFILEAFKLVREYRKYSMFDRAAVIKNILKNKWRKSSAISRTIDIFNSLKALGLYIKDSEFVDETEAVLGTADQFISRAYFDSGKPEFAPGPCYDTRGISLGIESNLDKEINSVHINLGVSDASKYIWAAYLAMYDYITASNFPKTIFNYYYSQIIKEENKTNGIDRRISYIGLWVDDIKDLRKVLEIFIPLTVALGNYVDQEDKELAQIWWNFRTGFESIIVEQNDLQLDEEFFQQARMVRFVELISENGRDNDFYRKVKELIESTLNKIRQAEEDKRRKKVPVMAYLSKRLKPLNKNWIGLFGEVRIHVSDKTTIEVASWGGDLLLKNTVNRQKLLITFAPKLIPVAGWRKQYVKIGNRRFRVFKYGLRDGENKMKFRFKRKENKKVVTIEGNLYQVLSDGLKDKKTGKKYRFQEKRTKRKVSFIFIGDRMYKVMKYGLYDLNSGAKFEFKKSKQGQLIVELNKITDNSELEKFLFNTIDTPKISAISKPDLSPETIRFLNASI